LSEKPSRRASAPLHTSSSKLWSAANFARNSKASRPREAYERITLGLATPRELVALRKSLVQLPVLKNFLTPPPAGGSELLRQLHQEIDELADVRERLERAFPMSLLRWPPTGNDSQRLPRGAG